MHVCITSYLGSYKSHVNGDHGLRMHSVRDTTSTLDSGHILRRVPWYPDAMRVYRICGEDKLTRAASARHFSGLWPRRPKRCLQYSRMLRGRSDGTKIRFALPLSTGNVTSEWNVRYHIADWQCINEKLQGKTMFTYDEKPANMIRDLTREITPCDGHFIRPEVDRVLHCVVSGPLTLNLGFAIDWGCEHLQR
jgi:hypothetical protein